MLFVEFSNYLEQIENISSRNEITIVLAELFSKVEVEEVNAITYLLLGRLRPKYDPLEFNFSVKLMLKALNGLTIGFGEQQKDKSKEVYDELGDIGEVVAKVVEEKSNPEKLTVIEVYNLLEEIAVTGGTGSQGMKIEKFQNLVKKVSPIEGKFIGRMVVGKLRLGVSDKTILDGLSWYKVGDKSLKKQIERAFGVRSDIGEIAHVVREYEGDELIQKLESLTIEPGIPVASKLVERVKSIEEVFERMNGCYVQPKLDGLRAQVHLFSSDKIPSNKGENKQVKIFSRNMENITDMFPDLVEAVKKLDVDSIVLDSEAIGFNTETGEYLPFQETIQRKRKHGVEDKVAEIPVKSLVFDVLYLNGEDLSGLEIEERMKKLDGVLNNNSTGGLIEKLETKKMVNVEELDAYFHLCVSEGLEGVIVKDFKTPYEPGTRNYDWIKLKASMQSSMVDTIDAIVLGYYYGVGSRSKFGIGAILIGLYDEKSDGYKTLVKVGTGITDDQFIQIKKDLDNCALKEVPKNYDIDRVLKPDVYVEPNIIVEVEADEVTRSKMHTIAKDEKGRGLSMRFPRLKIWNRKDKDVSQATSIKELESMV